MLCSHLKIAPSCRRFPPQTRGEHLWCRTPRDVSVDSWGSRFHDRCTCRYCAAPHAARNLIFYTFPFPEGATAAGCWSDLRAPPRTPCHSSQQLPPVVPRPPSCQPGSTGSRDLLPGNPCTCRCKAVPWAPTNRVTWEGFIIAHIVSFYTIPAPKTLQLSWMFTRCHIIWVSCTSYHFTFCLRKHYQKYSL